MTVKKSHVNRYRRTTPRGGIADVRAHFRRAKGVRGKAPILKRDGFDRYYQEGLDAAQKSVDGGVLPPDMGERIPFSDQMLYSAAQEAERKCRSLDPTVEVYYRAQADYFKELLEIREEGRKKAERVGGGFIINSDGRREWVEKKKKKDASPIWNWRGSGGISKADRSEEIATTKQEIRECHDRIDFAYNNMGYYDKDTDAKLKQLQQKLKRLEAERR